MKKVIVSLSIGFALLFSNCNAGNPAKANNTANTTISGDVIVLTNEVFKQKIFNYEKNKAWKYEGNLPVIIDFYASWCGPCMQFLPELQSFYTKYKGTRLEILGVSLDDNKEAWTGAVSEHKIEWKLISDLKGWKCEGSRAYAVNSIPSTVLIDKSGKIVGKNLSIPEMEKLLNEKVDKK